jgi:hypothetical protein
MKNWVRIQPSGNFWDLSDFAEARGPYRIQFRGLNHENDDNGAHETFDPNVDGEIEGFINVSPVSQTAPAGTVTMTRNALAPAVNTNMLKITGPGFVRGFFARNSFRITRAASPSWREVPPELGGLLDTVRISAAAYVFLYFTRIAKVERDMNYEAPPLYSVSSTILWPSKDGEVSKSVKFGGRKTRRKKRRRTRKKRRRKKRRKTRRKKRRKKRRRIKSRK